MNVSLPLLLPAPVVRFCHLCNMRLVGPPFLGRGFVVVPYTGRAYCPACLDQRLPSRLERIALDWTFSSLDRLVANLGEIVEAAAHKRLGTMRGDVAELADSLLEIAEKLASESAQTCAVCGCWQDDDGWWHWFQRGYESKTYRHRRSWVADDLCSACLGYYTPENTLAGQCDCCLEYSTRLTVRPGSQWADCPDCVPRIPIRYGMEGC